MKKKVYIAYITAEDMDGKNNPIDDLRQRCFTDYATLKRWIDRHDKELVKEFGEDATIYWNFTTQEIEL